MIGTPEQKAQALLRRAGRLLRLIQLAAPSIIVERERQLVMSAAASLEPEDKSLITDAAATFEGGSPA